MGYKQNMQGVGYTFVPPLNPLRVGDMESSSHASTCGLIKVRMQF